MVLFETLGLLAAALGAFLLFFYRDPEREPAGPGMVSPADGRVLSTEGGRVVIFMSLHDVHVNRAPLEGTVVRVRRLPGRFRPAHRDSEENERNEILLETARGPVEVVQRAGLLVRRIQCHVREGQRVSRGERVGRIVFGSRVDVTVPPGMELRVAAGQRVRAGETVIAT